MRNGHRQSRGLIDVLGTIEKINVWFGRITIVFLYILAFVMLYEVVARYAFNSPTMWASDLSMMLFAAICLLGGGYVLLRKGHVNLDILHNRLSTRGKAFVDLFTSLFFFVFIISLMWQGWSMFLESLSITELSQSTAWAPPLYPVRFLIPFGAALVLLQGLMKFIRDLVIALRSE